MGSEVRLLAAPRRTTLASFSQALGLLHGWGSTGTLGMVPAVRPAASMLGVLV